MFDNENLNQYNNPAALLGLDGTEDSELLGALRRMNPILRQQTINRLAPPPIPSKGSRAEMEKHFSLLPDHIKEGLLKNQLRLADTIIYSVKPCSNNRTIKVFEEKDEKEVGLRNISHAKLPKNQALLVSGIVLLAGTAVDSTKDNVLATNFDKIESFPALANGEFTLKANSKHIITESGNGVFKTAGNHSVPMGYYKLANPRLIIDEVLIEMTIELGAPVTIPHTHLFVGLHGTITTP